MRKLALVILAMFGACAYAQPIQLSGTIGAFPVFLDLSRNGDTVSGWYMYLKVGKQLRIAGKLDRNGYFQLDEYTPGTNTRTGSFNGRSKDGHWSGIWRNAAGNKPLDVVLDEVRGRLADVNSRFKCATRHRDRQFGYTYRHRIDLTLAKGQVKALSLFRGEKGEGGEDQSCQIDLSQLKQQRAGAGILLRAKGDKPDSGQHCTIRILPAGDFLVVKTGDPTQNGDDCRGAGDEMFCSPRSFWTDMIVNRTTQNCRSVQ